MTIDKGGNETGCPCKFCEHNAVKRCDCAACEYVRRNRLDKDEIHPGRPARDGAV